MEKICHIKKVDFFIELAFIVFCEITIDINIINSKVNLYVMLKRLSHGNYLNKI